MFLGREAAEGLGGALLPWWPWRMRGQSQIPKGRPPPCGPALALALRGGISPGTQGVTQALHPQSASLIGGASFISHLPLTPSPEEVPLPLSQQKLWEVGPPCKAQLSYLAGVGHRWDLTCAVVSHPITLVVLGP